MLQNQVFPYYKSCINDLDKLYEVISDSFKPDDFDDLCRIRGYVGEEQQNLVKSMQLGCCNIELDSLEDIKLIEDFGIISKKGNIILNERYIIPVYDISGNLSSLIGYYPDVRKYITLPTPYFSKECMFFNFKQAYELSWRNYNGYVILVEGIFDCLSLRSIGLPCIATMGASVSAIKCELLKLFKKVLAIPDDDETGRAALNRYSKKGWKVPYNTTFLKFYGGTCSFDGNLLHCKDMDNFVSWYEAEDVREILLSYYSSKEDIEELRLG